MIYHLSCDIVSRAANDRFFAFSNNDIEYLCYRKRKNVFAGFFIPKVKMPFFLIGSRLKKLFIKKADGINNIIRILVDSQLFWNQMRLLLSSVNVSS